MRPVLTIAILSIPERLDRIADLLDELLKQAFNKPVEILYLGDNMTKTVGQKRTDAVQIAKGEYICFIDDDDMVVPEYLEKILTALEQKPDVVTFHVDWKYSDRDDRIQVFGRVGRRVLDPEMRRKLGRPVVMCPPNHLCVWKRELAVQVAYPSKNKGEDHLWSELMFQKHLGKDRGLIVDIPEILYIYQYNKAVSRTQTR